MEGSEERDAPSRPAKRHRVALACTSCRARKSKCNGVHPSCSTCIDNGIICIYDAPTQQRLPLTVRQEDYGQLLGRVEVLEATVARLSERRSPKPGKSHDELEAPTSGSNANGSEGVDAMGIAYRVDRNRPGYFGSTSATNITEMLLRDAPVETIAQQEDEKSINAKPALLLRFPLSESVNGLLFPSFRVGDELLRIFQEDIWPIYPVVSLPTLRDIFYRIQSTSSWQSELPKAPQLGLLFSIFALAAAHVGAEKDGEAYYARAQKYMEHDHTSKPGDSLFQVCSHMYSVLYLQSGDRPSSAWHSIGKALRIAIGLGLHTSNTVAQFDTDELQEMGSRAWCSCLNIDRMVSMALGRPSTISSRIGSQRLPSKLSHEKGSEVNYLVHCTTLCKILGRILEDVHDESTVRPSDEATALQADLLAWREQLPLHLDARHCETTGHSSQGAVMLALRFHAIRMLLHRHAIQKHLQSLHSREEVPGSGHDPASIKVCVDSALETIQLLEIISRIPRNGGATWYRLYFLYNAFTILAGSLVIGGIPPQDWASRMAKCRSCVDMIIELGHNFSSARRCQSIVRAILDSLNRDLSGLAVLALPEGEEIPVTDAPAYTWTWPEDLGATAFPFEDHGIQMEDSLALFNGDLAWLNCQ